MKDAIRCAVLLKKFQAKKSIYDNLDFKTRQGKIVPKK